ncbi:MAG: FtsX-like permease family protein [Desulfobacteraceae bacterium]|nr:FtsX-like permease family protein [Desulfobacteraceae bacterium]
MFIHRKFIIRQITRSPKLAVILILCVTLAMVTVVAVNGFSKSLNRSLGNDAKALHAGDIIVRSNEDFSERLETTVSDMAARGLVTASRYLEFYSVVRSPENNTSVLAQLKVVDAEYPFYGRLELASGGRFREILSPGQVVAERNLLDRLGISTGAVLKVGFAELTVRDVVIKEPDRPVNVFSFGPRLFVSVRDLAALQLMGKGSRIRRVLLLKVSDETQLDALARQLSDSATPGSERVATYKTARSRVKRFLDDFLFFLNLVGVFILMVSGIGIQSACSAFLRERQKTAAIVKTMGATSGFIRLHFSTVVLALGLIGTVLGILLGIGLQHLLGILLSEFLPPDIRLDISWLGIFEAIILGIIVVLLFTLLPLSRLKDLKPVYIFRQETRRVKRGGTFVAALTGITGLFFGMILWHMDDIQFGLYFALGICGVILVTTLSAQAALFVIKRFHLRWLTARQAVKGLFRPGNATRSIVVTLSSALCVIFSIYMIEKNLAASFIDSYPQDAPNLFFIDIQPDQVNEFTRVIGDAPTYYPVIRARISAHNGKVIDQEEERKRRQDNLSRLFNLTYRETLLPDETIIEGGALFRTDWTGPQVSVLDTVLAMKSMEVGDHLTFKIQGVPLTARISSIRTRVKETFSPFFYFVFQDAVLEKAPQSIFTAVKVPGEQVAEIQNRVVEKFPNVSAIDLSDTIAVFAGLMTKLSGIIRLFAFLSIAAGILIMVSALLATRADRIAESVYFKILGAGRRFVLVVLTMENLFIGGVSALTALVIAQTGSFLICRYVFRVDYHPYLLSSVAMMFGTLVILSVVGRLSAAGILDKKPSTYLRERHDE